MTFQPGNKLGFQKGVSAHPEGRPRGSKNKFNILVKEFASETIGLFKKANLHLRGDAGWRDWILKNEDAYRMMVLEILRDIIKEQVKKEVDVNITGALNIFKWIGENGKSDNGPI